MTHKISDLTLDMQQPDLLISISKEAFGTFDFYKAKQIIEEGEFVTRNTLESTLLI